MGDEAPHGPADANDPPQRDDSREEPHGTALETVVADDAGEEPTASPTQQVTERTADPHPGSGIGTPATEPDEPPDVPVAETAAGPDLDPEPLSDHGEEEDDDDQAIEQTEDSFRRTVANKKNLLSRLFPLKRNHRKDKGVPVTVLKDDSTDVALATETAANPVGEDIPQHMDGEDAAPPIPYDLSTELGNLAIDDDEDDMFEEPFHPGTDQDAVSNASSSSTSHAIEPYTRLEIYSVHYKPSPVEQAAIQRLELELGVTEPTVSWKLFAKARVADPLKQAWARLVYSDKQTMPRSIVLQQGTVEWMPSETAVMDAKEHAAEPSEEAVEVAEQGQVLGGEPETRTNAEDATDASRHEQPMRMYLLTQGVVLADVSTTPQEGGSTLTLSHVIEWTRIHHVSPWHTHHAIRIHFRQPVDTSLTLRVPPMQLQPWLDAIHMMLVQNTLHSNRPHSDIGWQYGLVHVPWYTLAVLGDEDDGVVRNHGSLNHLDTFHHYAPLHYAIRRANVAAVRKLLDAGADPNLVDGDSHQTPMSMAQDVDDDEIVQLLLEFGAKRESKKDKQELFGRVTATEDAIQQRKEAKAREEERAAEIQRIKTERIQAQMAENIRLMQERGEQINEMGDKATAMHEGASEYSSLAKQLKEKAKQQAQPFSVPFSNPFKRGKGEK